MHHHARACIPPYAYPSLPPFLALLLPSPARLLHKCVQRPLPVSNPYPFLPPFLVLASIAGFFY